MPTNPAVQIQDAVLPVSNVWKDKIAPAMLAVCFGALLIFGMGFVNIEAVHNAAHDGRHSAGFPCH